MTDQTDTTATLTRAARDDAFSEDSALALLKKRDLAIETLEQISQAARTLRSRRVNLALASHPKTPRHISLPLLRQLFTFDLLQVALTPSVPADVKRAAEEVLISRIESLSSGEKLSLARRASGRVAAALLLDAELRVVEAALENSQLTEAELAGMISQKGSSAGLCQAACRHSSWSQRREVRIALLKSRNTPEGFAIEVAEALPLATVRELLDISELPAHTKSRIVECVCAKSPRP